MLTIRAMSDGKGYASRHLQNRDYYAEGERVIGQWQGRGAELLDLRGEVKTGDFEKLCQSIHPGSGEFLRQRHSADRVTSDGTFQSRGRNLYDFTISAPKSVSVMAVLGGDERLVEAHALAVAEALRELESCAASRVRQSGANEDRVTGNLAIAVYHHDTSREPIRSSTPMPWPPTSPTMGRKAAGRPCRLPPSTNGGPTSPRSTAIPSRPGLHRGIHRGLARQRLAAGFHA